MARNVATVVENNFRQGLITEATGLNYPENSCVEALNCRFDITGRVTRRFGFDLESGYVGYNVSLDGKVINEYLWKNVTGDGSLSFQVVQFGSILKVYNTVSSETLSAGLQTLEVDLTDYSPDNAPDPAGFDCQFTDGFGRLFVVHPYLTSFWVQYDVETSSFVTGSFDIHVRDLEGLPEDPALRIDERPTVDFAGLSISHHYNLLNQGWGDPYLQTWDDARTDMPSNCDVMFSFKNADEDFDVSTVGKVLRGNTPAPKGHYILNLYDKDRAGATGLEIDDETTGPNRVSCTAFFAGRCFFAGLNYVGHTSKIYFTKIVEGAEDFGKCYQMADPTSESIFDLQPSDGGYINIPEAGLILKMFVMGNNLIVFTSRGAWLITGSTGLGFTATDYVVSKISPYKALSHRNFADVNGSPVWWNTEGIFAIDSSSGNPQVKPLSFGTIQAFYTGIPNTSKGYAKGYFNPVTQEAQWLYRTTPAETTAENYEYDAVLVLNTLTGAFMPWVIRTDTVKLHGITVIETSSGVLSPIQVVNDSGDEVIDDSGNLVVVYELENQVVTPAFKYLVSYGDEVTWANENSRAYLDWSTYLEQGEDYDSYFLTGYKIHGEGLKKFQANFVNIYNEGTGQADIRGVWDYALNSNTGRLSNPQRLFFTDTDFSNNRTRVKIRGQGYSLQYLIRSVYGLPFTIIGWSTLETGNATA